MRSTMQDVPLSVADLVRHGTTVHGAAAVVTWTGGEPRRSSLAAVGRRAAQLAHALRDLGVTGDQRVATFQWNNQEHLESYLAVPAMGAVLHTLNIRLNPDQIAYVADHAEDHVVIVDASLLPVLTPVLPRLTTVRHVVVAGGGAEDLPAPESVPGGVQVHRYEDLLAGRPTEFDWPVVDERDAAAMCYTSGTTGDPKGVAYSHRSIWLHSMQVCMTDGLLVRPDDHVLAVVPMFHAMSWGLPYAALMVGCSLVLPDRFLQPGPLADMIAAERPTLAAAVPTVWQGLVRELADVPRDVSSLRQVVIGGAACPPALMRVFEERYGVPVLHAWGMTETSPLGTVAHPPPGSEGERRWSYRLSQGRLPASVRGRLVGPDDRPVPNDGHSVGELEVRGPWVTGRYHGDAGETGEAAAADRFHDGWLRTGDVGTLSPDGYLRLTDRSKDVIKSGGEWISSVELEGRLMAHPDVREAAVIAVPDETWGERPLAAVVLEPGATVEFAELRDFLAEHVARWQLPDWWAVVTEVPKTSVGKFDKKLIRHRHAEGELVAVRL
ncbi:long-chain fatty acid--CoA ligase [Marinactinospora rubrisoli]|uniref:Long-chain fatty acid--CoA ligase n=1 Tax=Marinactinospora rubrisoli TaxID=2715399 RepID=A0ABW2KLW2_9ACTN